MLTVESIADDLTLQKLGIRCGARLLEVNGHDVHDTLDYRFHSADERVVLLFETEKEQTVELELDRADLIGLALRFGPDKPKQCDNKCVFCFIHQLPKGLRRSLYVKDEDYRLSFQHGNYITLTNLTDADFRRIQEQRLSPLYISVHSTDDEIRRRMLGKKDTPPIVPQMNRLVESGIRLHAQVVLCPGMNDGVRLSRTIQDLARMHPGVQSVAVVPVGLTKHRKKLTPLERVSPEFATAAVEQLIGMGDHFTEELGIRFVYPADEFFILARLGIPPMSFYDDFPQIENGVGMVRQLMESGPAEIRSLVSRLTLTVVTGSLIAAHLREVLEYTWGRVGNLEHRIIPAENKLFGDTVTVSGLLGGRDIIEALEGSGGVGDVIIVPPDCLNDDGLFLDDLTLADVSDKFRRRVIQAEYSPADTLAKAVTEHSC